MPDLDNPYTPSQPVDKPDLFVGRRDVIASIREQLLRGRRVFIVSGERRVGKTTLLRHLPAHLPEKHVAVQLAFLEETPVQLDRLWQAMADAIERQLGSIGIGAASAEAEGRADEFLERLERQTGEVLGDRSLVLLLDDVHQLAKPEGGLLDALLGLLSSWRDRDERLAVILTALPSWQEALLRQHPRLFGGAATYRLGPLSSDEALRLITWPVEGVITYDFGVAQRLVETTSGHPHYLQLLCGELYDRCAPAGWVSQRDVDLAIEDLVRREVPGFRQIWNESSPPEQAVLAALASLRGVRGVATAQEVDKVLTTAGARLEHAQVVAPLENLVARGVLERLGALSYRFRVTLLRDWLGARVDLEEVVRDTRWDSVRRKGSTREKAVTRLRVGAERRQGTAARQPPAEHEPGSSEQPDRAARRLAPWIAGAVVLALIAVVVLSQLRSGPTAVEPTPAVTLSVTTQAQSPTKIPTVTTRTEPTQQPEAPAPVHSPTATLTPSPTPPLVVARPVPAIAYVSREAGEQNWAIYVMNSDGSSRTRVADIQAGFLSAPAWSPDGSRVAFVTEQDGAADIWAMNSDGSKPTNLTSHEAKDHSPAWSPDGEWIAFASVRDSVYWELYVMRADGSELQRLTWWEDASDLWPNWSPDGTHLAFASRRDGDWEIYVVDRGGSNLRRLTQNRADDTNPCWSPDGRSIAFESTRDGYAEIYVMPAEGGEAVNISNLAWATDRGPTWSPDGGRIAFYSDRDGEWDIYVMASNGSEVVKLTGNNTDDQVPAWRP